MTIIIIAIYVVGNGKPNIEQLIDIINKHIKVPITIHGNRENKFVEVDIWKSIELLFQQTVIHSVKKFDRVSRY